MIWEAVGGVWIGVEAVWAAAVESVAAPASIELASAASRAMESIWWFPACVQHKPSYGLLINLHARVSHLVSPSRPHVCMHMMKSSGSPGTACDRAWLPSVMQPTWCRCWRGACAGCPRGVVHGTRVAASAAVRATRVARGGRCPAARIE